MRALCLGPDGPFIDSAFQPTLRDGEETAGNSAAPTTQLLAWRERHAAAQN